MTFDLALWPENLKGSSTHQGLSTYQVWSFWGKAFLSYQLHKVNGYRHTDRQVQSNMPSFFKGGHKYLHVKIKDSLQLLWMGLHFLHLCPERACCYPVDNAVACRVHNLLWRQQNDSKTSHRITNRHNLVALVTTDLLKLAHLRVLHFPYIATWTNPFKLCSPSTITFPSKIFKEHFLCVDSLHTQFLHTFY